MYTVFGYDDMCVDFEHVYDSFVEAVKTFLEYDRVGMYVVFMRRESAGTCRYLF